MAKLSLLIWSTLLLVFFIALSESTHGRHNLDSPEPPILDDLFDRLESSNNKDDCHPSQPLRHTEPRRRNRFPLRPTRPQTRHYPQPIEPSRNLDDPDRVLVSLPNKHQKEDSSTVHKANDPKIKKKTILKHQWVIRHKKDDKITVGELSEIEDVLKRAGEEHLRHYYRDIPANGKSQMALRSGKREIVPKEELSKEPYSAIGAFTRVCTGTFIGPRHVLTAAHCLYNLDNKKWWLQSTDVFHRAKDCSPDMGVEYNWEMVVIPRKFMVDADMEYDYGLVIVQDQGVLPPVMNFGWEEDRAFIKGISVNIAGYPADKPDYCMWKDTSPQCMLSDSEVAPIERLLEHTCDAVPGNSGGPLYSFVQGVPTVLCVDSHGSRHNKCTRISKIVFAMLSHWIETISSEKEEKQQIQWIMRKNDADKTTSIATHDDVEKLYQFAKSVNLPKTFQEFTVQTEDDTNRAIIQGLDGREVVTENESPYSAIAMVTNGLSQKCTGTLIGPRHVITTASCIYDSKSYRWLDGYKVNFLHQKNKDKSSEYDWETVILPNEYVARMFKKVLPIYDSSLSDLDKYDFGLIILKDYTVSEPPMNFGWDKDSNVLDNEKSVTMVGYPGGESQDSMLKGECTMTSTKNELSKFILQHNCVTDLGDTGGPVYSGRPPIVNCIQKTIVTEPHKNSPFCLRITRMIFASLAFWIKEFP